MKNYKEFNAEVQSSLKGEGTENYSLQTSKGCEMRVCSVSNSEGYKQAIDTLTSIKADIIDTKVYSDNLSDFMRITSDGGFADSLTYFQTYPLGDADGQISVDGVSGQGGNVEFKVDKRVAQLETWKKGYDVSYMEIQQAQLSMNRSAIVSKERTYEDMKKSFLTRHGMIGTGNMKGLLNLDGVATDTTTIATDLSAMTQAQLEKVIPDMVKAFQARCNFTAKPDTLLLGSAERTMLARVYSEYDIKTVLELFQKAFATATENPNFKIVSTRYADAGVAGRSKNLYMLYNSQTVEMDIPFENEVIWTKGSDVRADKEVRFSEVFITRPLEAIYFEKA